MSKVQFLVEYSHEKDTLMVWLRDPGTIPGDPKLKTVSSASHGLSVIVDLEQQVIAAIFCHNMSKLVVDSISNRDTVFRGLVVDTETVQEEAYIDTGKDEFQNPLEVEEFYKKAQEELLNIFKKNKD